jgi:peptidoglycan/xylan/chitin deacetylase (PgdA/CDA1 family)
MMKSLFFNLRTLVLSVLGFLVISFTMAQSPVGKTEITRWQYGRTGAVSVTYDDGTINQFTKAVPIMNRLNLPGTFFIVTGFIPGSKYQAKFIGRPVQEIINESKTVPTNGDNFYERAAAARFLGYKGTSAYFTKAGAEIDAGRDAGACKILDELYRKVNNGEFQPEEESGRSRNRENVLTWDMARTVAAQGHEFGSHMIDHPYLGALDETNMLYEIEKSREEILNQLGPHHTFSAETPYCSVDKRVIEYAYKLYPVVRSRKHEPFLKEIRFSSHQSPVNESAEYVEWQRGTYTKTPLSEMKAWVDTTAAQKNIWLVLIIHGLDGIGWESVKSGEIEEYFEYIKSKEADLWVATYGDVTKYLRERMNAEIKTTEKKGKITVMLTHPLDQAIYNVPLTLRTTVRPEWKEATVKQGNDISRLKTMKVGKETYILYQASPNAGNIGITGI